MDEIISELRELNEQVPTPLTLPDMDDIVEIEEQLFISLGADFREFLLTVSDVVYRSIEPVTITDPQSHTYLPDVAAEAWSSGVPRDLVPLCQHANKYYLVDEYSEVMLWENGELAEKKWGNIWEWINEVWIAS